MGELLQGDVTSLQLNAVSLGDMLMQMGDTARARVVLESSLAAMDHDVQVDQRGEKWYYLMRPIALNLLGRHDEAITVLQKRAASHGGSGDWYFLELEPTVAHLAGGPPLCRPASPIPGSCAERTHGFCSDCVPKAWCPGAASLAVVRRLRRELLSYGTSAAVPIV